MELIAIAICIKLRAYSIGPTQKKMPRKRAYLKANLAISNATALFP